MSAEDDIRELLGLAHRAITAAHDGKQYDHWARKHTECYRRIQANCLADEAYRVAYAELTKRYLPRALGPVETAPTAPPGSP